MTEAEFRTLARAAIGSLSEAAEMAIRRELATPFDMGDSGRVQFEVDPFSYRVTLVQTENDIVPDDAVYESLPAGCDDAAEAAGLDAYAILCDEVVTWLADRWQAAGGPQRFSPAYAFVHGGLEQPRYDLVQRRWFNVVEVWPDAG